MLESLSATLIAAVLEHRYLVLYPVTILEGPLVTMAVGFAVQQKIMTAWIALPVVIAGDLTGDLVYYSIGRYGERWRWTRKALHHFGLEARKERLTEQFRRHGGKIALFGKLTHAAGSAFLVASGYAGMTLKAFLWYNFVGTAIKSSILMYVGYLAGEAYTEYARRFEWIAIVVTVVSIALVIVLALFGRKLFPEDPLEVK